MEAGGSSVRVFDGTTDFRVWRARVENELMRYQLLGYVLVRGYDGSQPFAFNGEQVPPRNCVENVDDASAVKEEASSASASCGRQVATNSHGRLSRWDVLGESAEAKSILQRFLHPDVECAILDKNIYDSWQMLCALYGNRSSPGAHDVYEMHRVLHHIRLGDKKGESVREFVTRWEMLVQQYALATGIELTDGFRSASMVQTLPSAWRPMVASWRGVRPFVPYPELVEKVITTRERLQAEAAHASNSTGGKPATSAATGSVVDTQRSSVQDKPTEKAASVKPVTQPVAKAAEATTHSAGNKVAEKQGGKPVGKPAAKPVEKRAAEAPRSTGTATNASKQAPPRIDVTTQANNTVDLTCGELSATSSSGKDDTTRSTKSPSTAKKSSTQRWDAASNTPWSPKSRKENDKREKSREESNGYEKGEIYRTHSNYDTSRGYSKYAPSDRHAKSPHKSRSRYEDKYESFDSYERNKSGPMSCFYCLKVGHHMKRCWYLKADIENGTTHDLHKKFSCAVTLDRNEFMVNSLEAFIDEENRARATSTPRSHRDYEVRDSVGLQYNLRQEKFMPPPPPGQPPAYAFRSDQQSGDYRKRSHSVFQAAESRVSSRDPRLNRSRSVYRPAGAVEDFSPRKRPRAPSFERQLGDYY